jgi:hypothetical protein
MFTPPMELIPLRAPKLDAIRARHPQDSDCRSLPPQSRPPNHSMSDDASRFGLRLVGELSATCSHRTHKRIERGIVWQAVSRLRLTHSEYAR